MIPSYFPAPLLVVYITGILELLGAAGLLVSRVKVLAGNCLIVLLIGMLLANVRRKKVSPYAANRLRHAGCGLRCRSSL